MPEASAGPAGVFYRLFNMSLLAPRRVTAVSAVCFLLLIAAVVFLLLTNA